MHGANRIIATSSSIMLALEYDGSRSVLCPKYCKINIPAASHHKSDTKNQTGQFDQDQIQRFCLPDTSCQSAQPAPPACYFQHSTHHVLLQAFCCNARGGWPMLYDVKTRSIQHWFRRFDSWKETDTKFHGGARYIFVSQIGLVTIAVVLVVDIQWAVVFCT